MNPGDVWPELVTTCRCWVSTCTSASMTPVPSRQHCSPSACLWESVACRSQHVRRGLIRCFEHNSHFIFSRTKSIFWKPREATRRSTRDCVCFPSGTEAGYKDPLPDGSSSPSNSCQSSDLSEPAESQQQSVPKLSFPLPGSLCPFQDLCTSLQEDRSVQTEREFLEGKERGRYRVEMTLP